MYLVSGNKTFYCLTFLTERTLIDFYCYRASTSFTLTSRNRRIADQYVLFSIATRPSCFILERAKFPAIRDATMQLVAGSNAFGNASTEWPSL